MRCKLFLLIFVIIISSSALALDVSLTSPTDTTSYTNTRNVTLTCKVTDTLSEGIHSLTLYHDFSGTFQENETNSSEVISGSDVNFNFYELPNSTYNWNCKATNASNDEFFAPSNYSFTIAVSTNNPPYSTEIPNQTWSEDTTKTLNLSQYFTDPDNDALTYTSSSISNIDVSISNEIVTLTPNANYTGTQEITFTASDTINQNTSNLILLNVTPVNDPPLLTSEIDDETWNKNNDKDIDLSTHFSDVDGDSLTYTHSSVSNINVTIDNSTGEVTLTPETDWTGTENITFTTYDPSLLSATSNIVKLTVKDITINNAPKIDSYSPLENPISYVNEQQVFSIEASDEDNDTLTIKWYLDNELKESNVYNYSYTSATPETKNIKVTVSDGSLTTTQEWILTIKEKEPTPVTTQQPEEPEEDRCGNNIIDEGETCSNCPLDVKCAEDEKCFEDKCIKEEKPNYKLIGIIVGVIIIATLALAGFFYFREKSVIKEFQFEEKPKKPLKEQPPVDIDDFYKEPEKPIIKEKPRKTTSSVILKTYIKDRLNKGETEKTIKRNLLTKGWNQEKIDAAFKEIEDANKKTTK